MMLLQLLMLISKQWMNGDTAGERVTTHTHDTVKLFSEFP